MAPSTGPSDGKLLDRLAVGDEHALLEIYDRHAPVVYGTAMHLLADVAGAADVTEAVFVELWTRAHQYATATEPLLALLTGLAHHHAVHTRRARRTGRIAPVLAALPPPARLPWN